MRIWVVMGTTGEYSDRDEWAVAAFSDKSLAEERIVLASRRAKEIEVQGESRYEVPKNSNEYDPGMKMDYTGTSYFHYEVELMIAARPDPKPQGAKP